MKFSVLAVIFLISIYYEIFSLSDADGSSYINMFLDDQLVDFSKIALCFSRDKTCLVDLNQILVNSTYKSFNMTLSNETEPLSWSYKLYANHLTKFYTFTDSVDINIPMMDLTLSIINLETQKLRIVSNDCYFNRANLKVSKLEISSVVRIELYLSNFIKIGSQGDQNVTRKFQDKMFSDSNQNNCIAWNDTIHFDPYQYYQSYDFQAGDLTDMNNTIFYLTSQKVKLEISSINSNILIASRKLSVTNGSSVFTSNSGYNNTSGLGTGSVVVSYNYLCGLSGGSYGGWGGYGISDNIKNTKDCIMSNYNHFEIYPQSVFPVSSGCPSSTIGTKINPNREDTSYGATAIIVRELYLDESSSITSGNFQNQQNGASGGSLFIGSQYWNIRGNITADGERNNQTYNKLAQNSKMNQIENDYDVNGEGGGGFVTLYKFCWKQKSCFDNHPINYNKLASCLQEQNVYIDPSSSVLDNKTFESDDKVTYAGEYGGYCKCGDNRSYPAGDNNDDCKSLACINGVPDGRCIRSKGVWSGKKVLCGNVILSRVTANKGERILPIWSKILETKILATDGIVNTTPCPLGTAGTYCKFCPLGNYRNTFYQDSCKPCNYSDLRNHTNFNSCTQYSCRTNSVILSILINPDCYPFRRIAYIQIYDKWVILLIIELSMMILMLIVLVFKSTNIWENYKENRKITLIKSHLRQGLKTGRIFYEKKDKNKNDSATIKSELPQNKIPNMIYMSGINEPADQWYLEWKFSKEFESQFKNNKFNNDFTEKLKEYIK